MNVTLVIPTYNNLRHIKNAYKSVRTFYPEVELVLLDDGSTDDTKTWLEELEDPFAIKYRSEERVGHTILYDVGIERATKEIVGILHADMIVGPNYLENVLKHLERGKVVCGTRVEPPLHPEGKEKLIRNFGMDFDDLNVEAFNKFALEAQQEYRDQTTKGMFAPWVLYKEDFQAIGGHDSLFAPFPYEDSDIFQRWILAGYDLIQSRDAFVYHLTCRGHRWTEQVGQDDDYFKRASNKAARNYMRKWGSWIANDEYQHPIIIPKYDVAFRVVNASLDLLYALEPWCSRIHIGVTNEEIVNQYIQQEQPNTTIDLRNKINVYDGDSEIAIYINGSTFNQQDYQIIQQLSQIIQHSGEVGKFALGNLEISIQEMNEYQNTLINV